MRYVHVKSDTNLWTVGFYDPDGKWHPESDHSYEIDATDRVAELNGGRPHRRLTSAESICGDMAFMVQLAHRANPEAVADKLIFLRDLLGVNLVVQYYDCKILVDDLDDAVSVAARINQMTPTPRFC